MQCEVAYIPFIQVLYMWLHLYLQRCGGKCGREGWQAHLHFPTHHSLGVAGTESSTGTLGSKAYRRNRYTISWLAMLKL